MRIYVFVEYYPNPYKPYFEEQFHELLREGHELRIFAEGKYEDVVNAEAVEGGLAAGTRYYPTTGRSLRGFLAEMVGSLAGHPWKRARSAVRIWRSSRPARENLLNVARTLVLPERSPDLCLIHDLSAARRFTFLRNLYSGVPVVLHFHGGEVPHQGTVPDPAFAFRCMDVVFTNTQYSKALALARGCDPQKILINPVGFELSRYQPREPRTYRPGGRLRVLSVGRISPEKGHSHALEALRRLGERGIRDIEYRIIGDGPGLEEVVRLVRENELSDRVEVLGVRSKREVIEEMERADVLLLPSVPTAACEENQACVLQESMLMGAVVLTTETGGVQESIPEVMRQFSVPCGDGTAIARKLERLRALSPEQMRRLGSLGREFVIGRYDVRAVTRRMLEEASRFLAESAAHRGRGNPSNGREFGAGRATGRGPAVGEGKKGRE